MHSSAETGVTTPHAVIVSDDDRVLVADRENDRVQVFTRDGDFLDAWTGFYHPMSLTLDARGEVLVSDQIPRLSRLDAKGTLTGRCRPCWNVPHGIACSPRGDIFVAEMNPPSVVKLALDRAA